MSNRILSLDGGGVRSLGFTKYLQFLEKEQGKTVQEMFDAFSGTSAGGVLAVLLSLGKSPLEVEEIGKDLFPEVFKAPPFWKKYIPFGSKYQNLNMRKAFERALGEQAHTLRMCDLPIPVYLTVTDLIDQVSIVYDKDNQDLVLDVLEKSSAAPTYFDPVDKRYVDGGVWANNPSLVGLLGYIRHQKVKIEDVTLISLGNGKIHHNPSVMKWSKYFTLIQWAELLVSFLIDGHEESNNFYCEQMPLKKYKRIQVDTGDVSLSEEISIPIIMQRWISASEEQRNNGDFDI